MACAQVSPAEVVNPQLRQLETAYLEKLKALNGSLSATSFPYPFVLSRYVGVDPGRQSGQDSRGIEFVRFRGRIVLKVTGNYNAALSAEDFTRNQRAARVFHDVFVPVLRLIGQEIPQDVACEGIGVEVGYHVRSKQKGYEYEGKEILVAVFDRAEAFRIAMAPDDAARQDVLNRSMVFVDGQDFGLSLGERDPLNPEALERSAPSRPAEPPVSVATASNAAAQLAAADPRLLPRDPSQPAAARAAAPGTTAASAPPAAVNPAPAPAPARAEPAPAAPAAPTPPPSREVVDQLQSKYQPKLDAFQKLGQAKFHFVEYAPPSFVVFQNRIALQLTLRNPTLFESATTSIYKRAAKDFDLFLGPQLRDLLDQTPDDALIQSLDVSVLTQFKSSAGRPSSEAIEFIFPLKALREFANAEITNQQLINQGVVLVNGVRIDLTLQLVE
ncbi:MAG: hypothetical protein LAN59_08325 [Acidobacteriia bacterium]|nr:hypothetical protein [Terriglobia bacterium]